MRSAILWMVISYFIGSIPTGYLAARLVKGVDIRAVGSGSIGATNVRRVMGQGWAVFVSIVDMLKGALALLVTATSASTAPWLLSLVGFAVVMGHNYPVWLKFRGGKGVATTYGVVFFLWPYESFAVALLSGAIWYAVMTTTRYVSLASMSSLLALPVFFWMLDAPFSFILVSLVLAVSSLYRHGSNIERLSQGRESRV
ncbi:MAG: glycerol-3-phosphate 1-O-acyltransferase PlsY [Synergistaceae bacterium]|nr:glycerol-3-phosphate 1-O-acyltransferase PlsY [Synergistaceae bacterium]